MSNANSSLTIRVGTIGIPGAMAQVRGLAASIVREFGAPLAGLATAGGLMTLAKSSINLTDTLGKTKQMVGMALREIGGLSYAANRSDVDLGSLRVGLKSFSEWLSKNGQGSRNLKEALLEQAAAFQAMPDGINKTNRAMDLFGKSGLQMIPLLNEGPKGLQNLLDRGERLTGVTDEMAQTANEFNDALSDTKVAAEGLAGSLALGLLPSITRTLNAATEGIVKFREWTKESVTFKIGIQAAGVALGTLAAYKLGSFAVGGLASLIGAGAITNLKDFVAAIGLVPTAAGAAALALGKFAAAIAAVTAVVTLAHAWWDYSKAQLQKSEADLRLTEANEVLTASLYRRIKADKEAGKISDDEYKSIQRRIIGANALAEQLKQSAALHEIVASNYPAGEAPDKRRPLTKEEFDQARAKEELMAATWRLNTAELTLNSSRATQATVMLADVGTLKEKLRLRRALTDQAHDDKIINDDERAKANLEDQKTFVALLQEELELKKRIIDSDPTTTNAEKFKKRKDAGIPQDDADPTSFTEQFSVKLVQLQNEIGTFSQASAGLLASGLGAGLTGIGDSIMGVITHAKNMGQIWIGVTRQMLASAIQFSVNQLAAFTLNKAKELLLHTTVETKKTVATLSGSTARTTASLNEASAEAVSTGAKAAGSVADIPYVGWALAIAAFGGIVAMIASASSAAKREHGGPVEAGKSYIVGEKRPELFVPNQNGYILPSVPDGFHSGIGGGSQPVNVAAAPVNVVVVNDQTQLKRFMESRAGERIVVKHIAGNRGEIGMQT